MSNEDTEKQAFRHRADADRQNFVLSQIEGKNSDEQVKIACRAGVSDPIELSSLLGRPLEKTDKRIMFHVLMWGESNSSDYPAFNSEYREWEKDQIWEEKKR